MLLNKFTEYFLTIVINWSFCLIRKRLKKGYKILIYIYSRIKQLFFIHLKINFAHLIYHLNHCVDIARVLFPFCLSRPKRRRIVWRGKKARNGGGYAISLLRWFRLFDAICGVAPFASVSPGTREIPVQFRFFIV